MKGVVSGPVWDLMCGLPLYQRYFRGDMINIEWLGDVIINITESFEL
jgi:hypothetical protein